MSISVYQAVMSPLTRTLAALSVILDKAEADAEARGIDPSVLINARLAPDMFPLSRQIQVAADSARNAAANLAGLPQPSHPDTETTFPELKARIAMIQEYLKGFTPEQFEGAETRTVTLKFPNGEMAFPALDYLFGFALPNFYFHASAAYMILRHNGVKVGKRDFLGG